MVQGDAGVLVLNSVTTRNQGVKRCVQQWQNPGIPASAQNGGGFVLACGAGQLLVMDRPVATLEAGAFHHRDAGLQQVMGDPAHILSGYADQGHIHLWQVAHMAHHGCALQAPGGRVRRGWATHDTGQRQLAFVGQGEGTGLAQPSQAHHGHLQSLLRVCHVGPPLPQLERIMRTSSGWVNAVAWTSAGLQPSRT